MHYVDKEQFTSVAWSIEQPNIIFFSGEKGNLEVWDVTKRRSEPIQTQNISGWVEVRCDNSQEQNLYVLPSPQDVKLVLPFL